MLTAVFYRHADLLQFIAQKESKCLELRTQLAVHENELGQLKKKWERIVSRGMDRAYASHPPASAPAHQTSHGHTAHASISTFIPSANAALKEGVRLIAAGLDISPVPSHGSPSPIMSPPAIPVSGFATVSRASLAAQLKANARHATTMSTSSVSTATTSTTSGSSQSQRLSQSSASSLTSSLSLDEGLEQEHTARANPIPIPEEKGEELAKPVEVSPSQGSKLLRRRSRDSAHEEESTVDTTSRVPQRPKPLLPSQHRARPSKSESQAIPPTPASPMSTIMTSVGRKWEEIQRGHT